MPVITMGLINLTFKVYRHFNQNPGKEEIMFY